jgi:general secretion pathway protein A
MYTQYWGLQKKPFDNTPDPEFLYRSSQHEEALARLLYAVQERKGLAVLTGVFGCGKTVLGQELLRELSEDRYRIAFINYPLLSHVEFLLAIAKSLGADNLPTKKSEVLINFVLDSLNGILLNNARDGKDSIVFIDEAHTIQDSQIPNRFLLTLILSGQPELREKLEINKQLSQRIAIKCHLTNLDLNNTFDYIIHRLKIAGRKEPIFTKEALQSIYDHTSGIPRRINRLCDLCLLTGLAKGLSLIDEAVVLEETRDLEVRI